MRKLALNDEILLKIEKPARYIGNEVNSVMKDPKKVDIRFAMCFPDIYEKAAEKLSLPPETCVVYEDILTGIRGAKMGGFAAVGVYDRSGEGNRAKMEQEADRYVTSFKELMNGGDSFF